MPQSLARVVIHVTFSTRDRFPFLHEPARSEMHRYLSTVCTNAGCSCHTVGGVADHVHILCSLGRSITISDLVRELKSNSSRWVKEKGGMLAKFAWQRGYAVISVGRKQLDAARQYIATQEKHHAIWTFQDEFRELMDRHGIDYDERYCWD